MMIPIRKLIVSPCQRFVQVAKVARIRTSGGQFVRNLGTAYLVTANRGQDSVGRMRHVTVVTLAPTRTCSMMCVRDHLRVCEKSLVTLRARPIVNSVPGELIVRIALVQGVAGQARELPPAIARRLDQP